MTTLEVEIFRFVLIIAGLALSTAVVIVIVWGAFIRRDHPGFINVPQLLVRISELVILNDNNLVLQINFVSVCVAFIPEGLPVCVTLSLAKIASSLSKEQVLCKSLTTVETLGSIDVLCTDK